ncbi:MAG: hypothetical protein ACLP1E_14035 [Acidimicrobiales bacterium]
MATRRARLLVKSATTLGAIAVVTAAVTVATLAPTMAPGAAGPAGASAARQSKDASPRCALPAHTANDRIVVPLVADFGGVNGKVIVTCVLAKAGESGAQVLQSQAQLLGYPSPRYAESGLLCAIDGYPTSGCGTQSGGHYAYWAYWHGGKRWQYANGGPGEWKVSKGDVEGWRFEPDGSATPADPPPRAASSATALETPARAGATTTSSLPSSGRAAGPVGSSGSTGRGTSPIPFVVSVAFILLIGATALLRSRRASNRAT